MCNALDLDDSYHIANLTHELGLLHDKNEQAETEDEQKRLTAARRQVSKKLIFMEGMLERGMRMTMRQGVCGPCTNRSI